jgi:hypothetical protein
MTRCATDAIHRDGTTHYGDGSQGLDCTGICHDYRRHALLILCRRKASSGTS